METMILLAVLIIIVIIGFFIMKRLGIFLDEVEDENKKDHGKKREGKTTFKNLFWICSGSGEDLCHASGSAFGQTERNRCGSRICGTA